MPKRTLTAKLKLILAPEQKTALDQTALAYRGALNHASAVAFEQGKITNQTKLHKLVYPELREKHKLRSQMACSVTREVTAKYKPFWTKLKQNKALRAAGWVIDSQKQPAFASLTICPRQGKDLPPDIWTLFVHWLYKHIKAWMP